MSHAAMNAVKVIVLMRKPGPRSVHTQLAEKENLAD